MQRATLAPSPRTELHRIPARGSYDVALVHSILDEALVCHLGFVHDDQPFVLPTAFARIEDRLVVHGAAASRMLKVVAGGVRVCVTVTLLDGLVLARSAFHHSMNYRSVVILGTATEITGEGAKRLAMDALVEKIRAGRSREARAPNAKELAATRVLSLPIEEASAKTRAGGPLDDAEDMAHPVWAGVVPLALREGAPLCDARDPQPPRA